MATRNGAYRGTRDRFPNLGIATIDTNLGTLLATARRLQKDFEQELGAGGFVEAAMKESLAWIQQAALRNLLSAESSHGRPNFASRSTDLLEKAVMNNKYSRVSGSEIEFFVRNLIFDDVPYYASLEYGDTSQIGRQIIFNVLGSTPTTAGALNPADGRLARPRQQFQQAKKPTMDRVNPVRPAGGESSGADRRGGGFEFSDRLIGPRERQRTGGIQNGERVRQGSSFKVTIKRPVPAYHYGRDAETQYFTNQTWSKIVKRLSAEWATRHHVTIEKGRIVSRRS